MKEKDFKTLCGHIQILFRVVLSTVFKIGLEQIAYV